MKRCMKRTNIYLADAQVAALADAARSQGLTRAELVRRYVDRGLCGTDSADLAAELAAIEQSFGVPANEQPAGSRGTDDRARHLDRVWRR